MASRYFYLSLPCLLATLLGACSGEIARVTPQTSVAPPATVRSWSALGTSQTKSLLYVSSTASNEVQMYDYQGGFVGPLVGQISIQSPGGLCVDKSGDVWVTSKYAVNEYAHGDTTPLRELPGEHAAPFACAVDPTTGNPAVSYDRPYERSETLGLVRVFGNGGGSKKFTGFSAAWFLAYDGKGDLFLDGLPCEGCYSTGTPDELFELREGADGFDGLKLHGATFAEPTGIAWINPTLLVADSGGGYQQPVGYKLFVHGDSATIESTLTFTSAQSVGGLAVRAPSILVPDALGNAVLTYNLTGTLLSKRTVAAPASIVVSKI